MGEAFQYICEQCGYSRTVWLGVGFMHPRTVAKTFQDVEHDRFGPRWRRLFEDHPHAGITAELELYRCDECGHWTNRRNVTLYERSDPDPDELYDLDGRPIFINPGVGWHVVEEYRPRCPKCRKRMCSLGSDMNNLHDMPLKCPKCGTMNQPWFDIIMWD